MDGKSEGKHSQPPHAAYAAAINQMILQVWRDAVEWDPHMAAELFRLDDELVDLLQRMDPASIARTAIDAGASPIFQPAALASLKSMLEGSLRQLPTSEMAMERMASALSGKK